VAAPASPLSGRLLDAASARAYSFGVSLRGVRRAVAAFLLFFIPLAAIDMELLAHRAVPLDADFSRFLDGVYVRTSRGETIVLVTSATLWDFYPFQSTVYALPGREVLPSLTPQPTSSTRMAAPKLEPWPANGRRVDYIVAWDLGRLPAGRVVWRDGKGVLLAP
jgi:hypothetical protein